MHFADRLFQAVREKESHVVVGLDPNPQLMPQKVFGGELGSAPVRKFVARAVERFIEGILDAVADVAVAVKPQLAYFERLGPYGLEAYETAVTGARDRGLLVITDGKRNDIGSTAEQYAVAYLGVEPSGPQTHGEGGAGLLEEADEEGPKADALTVNPYLGQDGIRPFLGDGVTTGLFVLVKTSNPTSGEFQDLRVVGGGSVAESVADVVQSLAKKTQGEEGYGNVGAVVGATYPEDLGTLRRAMPQAPFLIPGFGAQGAAADHVAPGFDESGVGAVVNASRSILYAYRQDDASPFDRAARRAAIAMRDALRRAVPLR